VAANSYAEALKTSFQLNANTTDTKFNAPPARKPSCKFQFTFDPNQFPNLNTKKHDNQQLIPIPALSPPSKPKTPKILQQLQK